MLTDESQVKNQNTQHDSNRSEQNSIPSISLPKGGGAIKGVGEKFATNPVTGTGSMAIPIATTEGRSGFSPELFLSYDSGSGNGIFGLGWHLSIPSITRKTDKGIPQYKDIEESDTFILSGAEDLVPIDEPEFEVTDSDYTIKQYRPRIEGLFARIELWTNKSDISDVYWRAFTKENITSIYGKDRNSRIFNPQNTSQIFSWILCESYDDKGNVIDYKYYEEDSENVDLSQVNEKNRTEQSRSANRYIKSIKYGNQTSRLVNPDFSQMRWHFGVLFDYDDWSIRQDPFSSYRSGFEVRTYRLCHAIKMYHYFEELGNEPYLASSTEFIYDQNSNASFITKVTQSGHQSDTKKSLPPLEFEYSEAVISEVIEQVDEESLKNLPIGVDGSQYRWVDLNGEGLSGVLTEQGKRWYYKPNLGNGKLGAITQVIPIPSAANLNSGRQELLDLDGDGEIELVAFDGVTAGFYERNDEEQWSNFTPFKSQPNINWSDPNLKFIDLTGDGHADILITEDNVFTWHPSFKQEGFGASTKRYKAFDEEAGPALVFADGTQSVYLADFSGDGLSDIVRIRNGEVCYWSNLGYGRFGQKVTMDNAPWFDYPDQFNQNQIRLADIDGSGVTDILYLGKGKVSLYFNNAGNSWNDAKTVNFPYIDNLSTVNVVDLKGNGTACLVWSSPLPSKRHQQMSYIDLLSEGKPHLLVKTANNLGVETTIQYVSSTKFYLADKAAGKPWITKLPFPVHCVETVSVTDKWRKTIFSTQYTYHHGYFDGIEREFRGFGRVDQLDVETYGEFIHGNESSPYITDDKTLYQPPVKTITWFHTGAFIDRERILSQFQDEYFPNWLDEAGYSLKADYAFSERALPEPDMTDLDLSTAEWREALRACKGMTLRQEVYELDVDALEEGLHLPVKLFTAAVHNCQIRLIQPKAENHHAVFLVTESEALSYHYELDLKDNILSPDPRIAHTLILNTNQYGQPLQQAAVAYPRVQPFTNTSSSFSSETQALIREVQAEIHISYTETKYTHDVDLEEHYRLRLPYEVSTYELTGIRPQDEDDRQTADPWDDIYFTLEELRCFRLSDIYQNEGLNVEVISYHHHPDRINPQKRRVEQVRTLYFDENLTDPLPLSELNHLGLTYETYKLTFTDDLLDAILREKLETLVENGETYTATLTRILESGGYHRWDGQWWIRSGIAGFAHDAREHYYLPERYTDPFGEVTELTYDPYDLYIQKTVDPLDNTASVEAFDFRVMAPTIMKDQNDNYSAVAFNALGMPVATAVMGKDQTESGDNLSQLQIDLTTDEITPFFTGEAYSEAQAREWLAQATGRFVYYFGEKIEADDSVTYGHHPACACAIVRKKHVNQLNADESTPLQTAFEYSDGMGQVLVSKVQAEPETAGGSIRWLATGKTILNNKGKPVKQYEPYFSESAHRFEEPIEAGVTSVMYYDAVGRPVRTEQPSGAYSRVEFFPWFMAAYDPNDTVLETGNAWFERNSAMDALPESRRVAELTAVHADTPAVTYLDSFGRDVIAVAQNRYLDDFNAEVEEKYITFTKLDAEGKPLWIEDARGNRVMQYIVENSASEPIPCYDIAGNLLFQHSMDAGNSWMLNDIAGNPFYAWDSRDNIFQTTYDALRRPITLELRNDSHAEWIVVGCTRYGDEHGLSEEWEAEARLRNLRGQPYRSYDQSGRVTNESFDFKGNALELRRRLALAYEGDIDWQSALALLPEQESDELLMDETFSQTVEYDALNRVTRQYNWHKGSSVSVVEPRYNIRSLLEEEDVVLEALKTDEGYEGGTRRSMIRKITYNEKGQRLSITYDNGTTTLYSYDPETFQLIHLHTQRNTDNKTLQDLYYTYDPSGNITGIIDNAQPTVFFNNFQIDVRNRYTYDALYRLIKAEGREHAGQASRGAYDNWHNCGFQKRYHSNDAMAWRNYTERYRYDLVGNILSVHHAAQGDSSNSWIRQYQYEQTSNRLLATGMGGAQVDHYPDTPNLNYRYGYNVHGSITSLPHLETMDWDFTEHLQHIARTAGTQGEGDEGCPDPSLEAWYRYDAAKQRTRKRVVKQNGRVEERLYLGEIEIFRKYDGRGRLTLERETLHIMDGQQRIAVVEARTQGNDGSPEQLIRYQLNNHLGSSSLELDGEARVISYEEYYPYGSTSYQAMDQEIKAAAKCYRYTGKERDDETGLYYYGARYYAAWLGRWVSCDPVGIRGGINPYQYVTSNPVRKIDKFGEQDEESPWFLQQSIDPIDAAVQKVESIVSTHKQKIKERGYGTHYGMESNFATKTEQQQAEYLKLLRGLREVVTREHPPSWSFTAPLEMPKETSCIDFVMEVIGAYLENVKVEKSFQDAATEAEELVEWSKGGLARGRITALQNFLQEQHGFSGILFSSNPGNREYQRARQLKKVGYWPSGRKYGQDIYVQGVKVTARVDIAISGNRGLQQLKNIRFAVGATYQPGGDGWGYHSFVVIEGQVYEQHWSEEPESSLVFEKTTIDEFVRQHPVIFLMPPSHC